MPPQPRTKRYARVPIDAIQPFPGNPRIGHRPTLDASLSEHDQFDDLIVQESTGYIIAGNNTWHAMKDAGATEVDAAFLDVTDEQALRMNLVHNRAGDKSTYDDRLLLERLGELDDLDGTGYEPGDLQALESSLTAPDLDELAETVGEPQSEDGWPTLSVKVPHQVMAAWNSHLSTHNKDGAACVITAEHGCMSVRGVGEHQAVTTTFAWGGSWSADHPEGRAVLAEHGRAV